MRSKIFLCLTTACMLLNPCLTASLETEVKQLQNNYEQQKNAIKAVVVNNPELKRHWEAILDTIKHAMQSAQDMFAPQFRGADPLQGAFLQAKVRYEAALKMMTTERLIVENLNDLSDQLNNQY